MREIKVLNNEIVANKNIGLPISDLYPKYALSGLKSLLKFRQNMNCKLTYEKIGEIWGEAPLKELTSACKTLPHIDEMLLEEEPLSQVALTKIEFVQNHMKSLYVRGIVKFIGISGSVAAGFAHEDDDIDIFVVVKNNCMWIYRQIILLRSVLTNIFRRANSADTSDKLCVNYIVEERGLCFDKKDIFTFHELFYVIPVYNPGYKEKVVSYNSWMERYGVVREWKSVPANRVTITNICLMIANFICFIMQAIYMFLHKPNVRRIINNYRRGEIAFYPDRVID